MSIYEINVINIEGQPVKLEHFRGKLCLIVNTASRCGFTPQFQGLQQLYQKYRDCGFVVLGFPCNDFLHQDPSSNFEIQQFCQLNYGVDFPMFAKISVRGKDQHPLYRYLVQRNSNPTYGGSIKWNFTKFLISPTGAILGRYGSLIGPAHPKLLADIEKALPSKCP